MLLFIAEYPTPESEKDGMAQRIIAIDKLFHDKKRVYLQISFDKNIIPVFEKHTENLKVYKLNFYLHSFIIIFLFFISNKIYVHSIFNSLRVFPYYMLFKKKIITDMHGVVPEELEFLGKKKHIKLFNYIEKIAVFNSNVVVTVSKTMAAHLLDKYNIQENKLMNLYIFDKTNVMPNTSNSSKLSIIYSGGIQKWQNIDIMLDAISKLKVSFNFIVLTGDYDLMLAKIKDLNLEGIVKIYSVPKEEVYDYYKQSDMGFILRDDNIVNRAACPTKLIEYLSCGLVPVVLQPYIGDFKDLGYSYVLLEDLLSGKIPTVEEIETMRSINYTIINKLFESVNESTQQLLIECSK